MKAIILAAGEGTRLKPITNTTPKPLIKIVGKTIIEHNLEHIYKHVDEIIIVVKYLKDKFPESLGNNYKGVKISYHNQNKEKGTAAAIKGININGDFILLNGDSIFEKNDIEKIIKLKGYGALVKKTTTPEKYGIFKSNNELLALEIVEKPVNFIGNLANLGIYKFNSSIFEIIENINISPRGEYEITDAINDFIKIKDFQLLKISGDFIDIGYPWDILSANSYFLEKENPNIAGGWKSEIKGRIEDGVTIKGNIVLEEGAILKTGTYIEGNCYIGKNTSVGPNAYLRGNNVIGNDCGIGAIELKEVSIGDYTKAKHFGYIGSSIIGENVNISAGFISMDRRHDNKNIKFLVKGELLNTGRRKLGCVIGDNVRTGVNTLVYPGRVIENDIMTIPGEMIK